MKTTDTRSVMLRNMEKAKYKRLKRRAAKLMEQNKGYPLDDPIWIDSIVAAMEWAQTQ